MEIILIGFMGTGKTTIGKLLAKKLHKPHYDLDNLITKNYGNSVQNIFKEKGEKYFRKLEHQTLKDILNLSGILSTGGGTPMLENNTSLLKHTSAKILLLKAKSDTIFHRLKEDTSRPLLKNSGLKGIIKLQNIRKNKYENISNLTIQTDNLPPSEIIKIIFQRYYFHLGQTIY